ncbi:methionyl-tRNA formyltransferase [Candidatus Saccharibacteria bacterium]|nr:methionyl-tRNA formyltransferase [Candidatus Saccharibacteria bacterium]
MNNIVFFGTEDFSLITLRALVEANLPVAAVVTKPDSPKGRGHHLTQPIVKIYASEHDIPVWQPTKLSEITDNIKALNNPVGVLVSFGKIIPQSIIDLFDPGIINVHPSRLPKYRGPSPIETAILNGDKETAVSIMQLSAAMDAGPVYGYAPLDLTGTETRAELYDRLGELGAQTLLRLLPLIMNGEVTGQPQDDSSASYCKLISKTDGLIDWNKPALQIQREIRAYAGWPQSRTTLGGIDVIIISAQVKSGAAAPGEVVINGNELTVGTAENLLSIDIIKPLGKKEMPISAFLSGHRSQLID